MPIVRFKIVVTLVMIWTGALLAHGQSSPELTLAVVPASHYVMPEGTVVVQMNVSGLPVKVNACQAMLGYSSLYFQAPAAGSVTAGGGVWDLVIWDSWKDGVGVAGEIDTAIGVDAQGGIGTDVDGTIAIITLTAGSVEGITTLVFRPDPEPDQDPGLTRSTFLCDLAANPLWPLKFDSQEIVIDGTPPVVAVAGALQGAASVLNGASTAVQGTVEIAVTATDALAGLAGPPEVTLSNGAASVSLATSDAASPFHYAWAIGASASNGRWDIRATATDRAGNAQTTDGDYVLVNKNQITGQVAMPGFVGTGTVPANTRSVTWVATGGTTKTWTLPLSFNLGVASYTLAEVPEGTTHLSAKTDWSLRRKVAAALDANGQATANFTGAAVLTSGDITGDNIVNLADYNLLKRHWFQAAPAADLDGNGVVNLADYNLIKAAWFGRGDLP